MMKNLLRITAVLLILVVAAIGTAAAAPENPANEHVITSTGTGNIIATPDRAQVTFSVQTENTDVKRAQAENSAKMNTVIDALIASGIPRDALKTTGFNIYPVYEDSVGYFKPKVKTYQVTNTLTVTLHDVSKTGEVIDIAVANGITQADSIRFMLSDQQQKALRTEALKKAVEQARSDADTVAQAMGTAITGVKSADIGGGYYPVAFQNYQYAGAADMKMASETPVEPGAVTVSATVTISYLIR